MVLTENNKSWNFRIAHLRCHYCCIFFT